MTEVLRIVRVFPRRTSHTPCDALAFVGDPPLFMPEADEVHVSVTFTWDVAEAERLAVAWAQHYPVVRLGGPANGCDGEFVPGRYVRRGITFTSRGCDNDCPWCLVPGREGSLRELPVIDGDVVQDNNFLQCSEAHRRKVYRMLSWQPRAAVFAGGLETALITDAVAEELRGLRIGCVFLAADTDAALRPLERALRKLSFLHRRQLRCYVLCGYGDQTVRQAEARLERVWELGAMPFAQLYEPADYRIEYGPEWRRLARKWSRPAAMAATHRVDQDIG